MPDNTTNHRYFLRNKTKQDSYVSPACLAHKINTKTATLPFDEIIRVADINYSYIPVIWPVAKDQRGHTCGLYALETALKYAYGRSGIATPPARKNNNSDVVSLRQVAKEENLTSFGELFNVNAIKKLTKHFNFPYCDVVNLDTNNEKKYTSTICAELMNNRVAIVSLDSKGGFPGNRKGLGTHWALLFGYLYINDQCYFLATQYGKYYLFSAKELYESNKQLPMKNPKRQPFYVYFKEPLYNQEIFTKNQKGIASLKQEVRYAIGDTLQDFRFSLFCMTVVDPPLVVDVAAFRRQNLLDEVNTTNLELT